MALSSRLVGPWNRMEEVEWPAAMLYALRCALAGSTAFELATLSGLDRPVWATVSALVVSQETEGDTIDAIFGRSLGTLLGAVVALAVNRVGSFFISATAIELAVATATCAIVTVKRPRVRVAVWTCAIVLITAGAEVSPVRAAASRASEVLIGALVGGAIATLFRESRLLLKGHKTWH